MSRSRSKPGRSSRSKKQTDVLWGRATPWANAYGFAVLLTFLIVGAIAFLSTNIREDPVWGGKLVLGLLGVVVLQFLILMWAGFAKNEIPVWKWIDLIGELSAPEDLGTLTGKRAARSAMVHIAIIALVYAVAFSILFGRPGS